MIRVLLLAAALSASAPAFAQTAPAPAPSASAPAPTEAEFETTAEAFGARIEAMQVEMSTAITNTEGDPTRRDAELDAIEAKYQPDVEAFVVAMQAFLDGQAAQVPEAQRAEMQAGIAAALPRIRGVTAEVRAGMERSVAAAPAAGS